MRFLVIALCAGTLWAQGTNPIIQGDLPILGNLDLGSTKGAVIEVPNSATGTTANRLAKFVVNGGVVQAQVLTTSAADQSAAAGVVISGAGASGNARILIVGTGTAAYDGATTAGHVVVPSSTIAGALHDTGSTSSSITQQNLGYAAATDACGSPPCNVLTVLMTPDLVAQGSGGAGGNNGNGNGNQKCGTAGQILISDGRKMVCITTLAGGATVDYYIATNGNDSNDCSSGSKCLTLAHALSLIPATIINPYVIHVADGTYAEGISVVGYTSQGENGITIVGNTTTPANVVFSGTVNCLFPDSVGTYTADACIESSRVKLSGLKVSGTVTRAVFAHGDTRLLLDNFTSTAAATVAAVQVAGPNASIELTGTNAISGWNSSGAYCLYGNQGGTFEQYAGSVTCAGATGNNTQVGLNLQQGANYEIHQGASATLTITGIQTGAFLTGNSIFSSRVSSGAITITNSATPTASTGIYAEIGSQWNGNPTTLTMDRFTTGLKADGLAGIWQKLGSITNSGAASQTNGGLVLTF